MPIDCIQKQKVTHVFQRPIRRKCTGSYSKIRAKNQMTDGPIFLFWQFLVPLQLERASRAKALSEIKKMLLIVFLPPLLITKDIFRTITWGLQFWRHQLHHLFQPSGNGHWSPHHGAESKYKTSEKDWIVCVGRRHILGDQSALQVGYWRCSARRWRTIGPLWHLVCLFVSFF